LREGRSRRAQEQGNARQSESVRTLHGSPISIVIDEVGRSFAAQVNSFTLILEF
jgi:hypothetical protein